MRLIVQGLNPAKFEIEKFEFFLEISELDNLYFTFDSIYLLKKLNGHTNLFIYDPNINNLKYLENYLFDKNYQLLNCCTNTNFFWCLLMNKHNSKIEIFQFSNKYIVNKIEISEIKYENALKLVIQSTDVNTYIFENGPNQLRCVYELRTKKDLEKKIIEQEEKLNENSISSIELNKILINQSVKQFSCGKEHILMLSEKGQVYSFGMGTKGQLGHGKIENCFEPKLIDNFEAEIQQLPSGNIGWHSAALDINGNCYLWGWNSHGQVGVLDNDSVFITKPTKIQVKDNLTDKSIKFKAISLGARHSAILDEENNLYTFGWNKYEQLMLENENKSEFLDDENEQNNNIDFPIKIIEYENNVISLKCGCWLTSILIKD